MTFLVWLMKGNKSPGGKSVILAKTLRCQNLGLYVDVIILLIHNEMEMSTRSCSMITHMCISCREHCVCIWVLTFSMLVVAFVTKLIKQLSSLMVHDDREIFMCGSQWASEVKACFYHHWLLKYPIKYTRVYFQEVQIWVDISTSDKGDGGGNCCHACAGSIV